MTPTAELVETLRAAGQDFEWYPTTKRMIDLICRDAFKGDRAPHDKPDSILDIGAGDGRALMMFREHLDLAKLYAIEKAPILLQKQPDEIIPVGTEFFEQDLMGLPVSIAFSNPPYSEFEAWAERIISTVHAHALYLILPERWKDSDAIAHALKLREGKAKAIASDDFLDAERRARAHVDILRITFADSDLRDRYWQGYKPHQDPFDLWFDQNISTFEKETETDVSDYEHDQKALAKLHKLDSIASLVEAFNEEYDRMQEHYKAIFKLDAALLKELGVSKETVREGLKKRMQGLKNIYWRALFEHLDAITCRLTTKTKKTFLERLTGQTAVAFTTSNAYAVVLWAIKAANAYFDAQIIDVYKQLSTHDGVTNYVSNQRTWQKDGWRYNSDEFSHYKLDYRIVLNHYRAIYGNETFGAYEYPGGLHNNAHEVIDDLIAVFSNLGFTVQDITSRTRQWSANQWQDFTGTDNETVFQVKGFLNGNLHFRFLPNAIKALNIEAGRLLGWLRSPADVVRELGYSSADATRYFGANQLLGAGSVKLLQAAPPPQAPPTPIPTPKPELVSPPPAYTLEDTTPASSGLLF